MKIEKIKNSITRKEYDLLQADLETNKRLRPASKRNLSRVYCNCFYTGVRLNENQGKVIENIKIGMFVSNMQELITTGSTVIVTPKTKKERRLYISESYLADIQKYFDLEEHRDNLIIAKGSNKNNRSSINVNVFTDQVNKHMQSVLGSGFSSHSFRQGLITEMSRTTHPKVLQKFTGLCFKQTMAYIKPTEEDVLKAIVR